MFRRCYRHLCSPEKQLETIKCDLLVMGGGSGGIAAAKRAAVNHKKNVVLADFVSPSPAGTKWGLGGTCVNVGCIPKKLMHTAALQGEVLRHTAKEYGWEYNNIDNNNSIKHSWETLRNNVTGHIRSLNFGATVSLRENNIKYVNAESSFAPDGTGAVILKKKFRVEADNIIIATGSRPSYVPDIPGAREHGITSDDLFRLSREPKETVVVGAGYIALECAGFLAGLGYKTTVLVRSTPLRTFDSDVARRLVDYMEKQCGVRFFYDEPAAVVKDDSTGRLSVKLKKGDAALECDTFMMATGRTPNSRALGLEHIGADVIKSSGKIVVDDAERTTASTSKNVFAIGDVANRGGSMELTPVAIRAGELLVDRLFGTSTRKMRYELVPTTVFTPLEYGSVGLSEEDAATRYGADKIEVYHSELWPLEWTVPHLPNSNACYCKVVTLLPRGPDDDDDGLVVGFHILCPNAGELTQGIAIAMHAGLTKRAMDETVGIHPTVAEILCNLHVTKRSGKSVAAPGC
eukprot:PhM_4_TR18054/c2_g1_i1/m.41064/K22182/TXNRD; thioredoxin reductase (NADPH)